LGQRLRKTRKSSGEDDPIGQPSVEGGVPEERGKEKKPGREQARVELEIGRRFPRCAALSKSFLKAGRQLVDAVDGAVGRKGNRSGRGREGLKSLSGRSPNFKGRGETRHWLAPRIRMLSREKEEEWGQKSAVSRAPSKLQARGQSH